ncbi:MAG: hypothetical protein LE180_02725 [Endomicrobium sp.]|uniref:hypothetical protein n=1 Tax=Candidatus Endomicrobiellum pyrsonymphae TaxID=1408203 RepID=UPI00357457D2|nr:hypothetical protein [Endomicrobium sp.]
MRERERDSAIGATTQERQEIPKINVQTSQYLQIEDAEKSGQLQIYSLHQNVVPVNFTETDSKDIQVENISPLNDCTANVVEETSTSPLLCLFLSDSATCKETLHLFYGFVRFILCKH